MTSTFSSIIDSANLISEGFRPLFSTNFTGCNATKKIKIEKAIAESGFSLDTSNALKRVPRGYTVAPEYEYLLRQKEFCLVHQLDSDWFLQPNWVDQTLSLFKKATPFITIMNRAIEFAYEEKK